MLDSLFSFYRRRYSNSCNKKTFKEKILYWSYRLLTRYFRAKPDFLIIGTLKGGSTAIYEYLAQHPYIYRGFCKEVRFFDKNFQKGINWYKAHFPLQSELLLRERLFKHKVLTFEASPNYFFDPRTPKRVHSLMPNVKLMAILRNPIDRAYSQYQHHLRLGRETLSFEEVLNKEPSRIKGELKKILTDEDYQSKNYISYTYLTRGIYVDQIKRWLNFFQKENLLLISSEELDSKPDFVYKEVLDFLGLPYKPVDFVKYNEARYKEMDKNTRKRLVKYFEPYNKRLYNLLGRDFNWDN